jgi:replication-associated recombination protein RarA
MLWVDKHRPLSLDKLDFHEDLTEQLRRISHPDVVGNMSHLLFYGPSGAGKKTRVMALLREVVSNFHILFALCVGVAGGAKIHHTKKELLPAH